MIMNSVLINSTVVGDFFCNLHGRNRILDICQILAGPGSVHVAATKNVIA